MYRNADQLAHAQLKEYRIDSNIRNDIKPHSSQYAYKIRKS